MFSKRIFLAIAALALVTLACGININLPMERINPGAVQTEEISIPAVGTSDPVNLTIGFGAGELDIHPGAQDALVEGTAEYNVPELKPEITVDGNTVLLKTGEMKIKGLPIFGDKYKNIWDLKLGESLLDLTINAGAYQGKIELGGLSIGSLTVADGASQAEWSFSQPNLVEMDTLRYETGASSVSLEGLANSRASKIIFKGGAGDYTLDFSGQLQKDMDVSVDAGISNVKIVVPKGVPARLNFNGGLSNVDVNGNWEKSGNVYKMVGDGPEITFDVTMGAGNLELQNR